jgi:hypothetical protein
MNKKRFRRHLGFNRHSNIHARQHFFLSFPISNTSKTCKNIIFYLWDKRVDIWPHTTNEISLVQKFITQCTSQYESTMLVCFRSQGSECLFLLDFFLFLYQFNFILFHSMWATALSFTNSDANSIVRMTFQLLFLTAFNFNVI